jgi:hypothetical protein
MNSEMRALKSVVPCYRIANKMRTWDTARCNSPSSYLLRLNFFLVWHTRSLRFVRWAQVRWTSHFTALIQLSSRTSQPDVVRSHTASCAIARRNILTWEHCVDLLKRTRWKTCDKKGGMFPYGNYLSVITGWTFVSKSILCISEKYYCIYIVCLFLSVMCWQRRQHFRS